jgi:release factor glutamine methyltransferase
VSTWRAVLADAARSLGEAGLPSPTVDARRIVEAVSEQPDGALALAAEEPVPTLAERRVGVMVERRRRGEPLQYVLGSWSFCGLELFVDERVLIPRPETERTAELAVDEAARLGLRRGRSDPWRDSRGSELVADLGTGSGAIALALAAALPDALVWATDRSADALAVAQANLAGSAGAATRVRLAQGDWFDALPDELRGSFRLLVSNPPYVAAPEVADLPDEIVGHEPLDALVSGPTGLEAIERVVTGAPEFLDPTGGALVVELAPHQADPATQLARDVGFVDVRVERDLADRERVLVARGGDTGG